MDAPRGVLMRFGVVSALALAIAGVALVWVVRADVRRMAEQNMTTHTAFVANTILRDHLRASDFSAPAQGARLAQLDALFRREILVNETKRAKLYSRKGIVVYSTDHSLIGTVTDDPGELHEVLTGQRLRDVSQLNHEGGDGRNIKALESYVPFVPRGQGRPAAVFEIYSDYTPVAAEVATVTHEVVAALSLALIALYLLLFPVLRRMTVALERRNRGLAERTAELSQALRRLQSSERELQTSQEETIRRLSVAAEYRDEETGHHIERMSRYSAIIARELGLEEELVELIRTSAPLHDVGKIATPDAILLKPGALTPEERDVMEEHARLGGEMLAGSTSDLLQMAATIASTHHEKVDGSGYPNRLRGDEIPLVGRIAAVADVFDALTSDRVYRPAMSTERALEIMREGRGSHFDPEVFDAFERVLDEVLEVRSRLADLVPAVV